LRASEASAATTSADSDLMALSASTGIRPAESCIAIAAKPSPLIGPAPYADLTTPKSINSLQASKEA
jgi:hypothetical protein